ncbi:ABC transporter substrate-binding protein [Microbispora sp. CA-102843]|uniref:ABC transporter substrate-binding protein n=1 Tax=Microbispora sp. CA-102843 TaxID=3239952 RepID=UPI003D940B6B
MPVSDSLRLWGEPAGGRVRAHPSRASSRTRSRSLLPAIAVSLIAALFATACGGGGGRGADDGRAAAAFPSVDTADPLAPVPLKEPKTVRVAVTSGALSYGAVFAANGLGEFKKENLTADVQVLPAQDAHVLLSQGRLDVAVTIPTPGVLNLISGGAGARVVFPGGGRQEDSTQGWYINKKALGPNGKFDAADVKGVTLGVPTGKASGAMGLFFEKVRAEGVDLKPDDVTFENLAGADIAGALERGAIDVGYISNPFNDVIIKSGCCEIMPGLISSRPSVYYWFSDSLRTQNPDVGLAFVRALARTTQTYLQGDFRADEKVVSALAAGSGTEANVVRTLEPNKFGTDLDGVPEEIASYQSWYLETDALSYTTPLTAGQIIDRRFVDALKVGQKTR